MADPYSRYARPVSAAPTTKERAAEQDAAIRAAQLAKLQQDYERTNKTPIPQPTPPRETPQEKGRSAYMGEIGTSTAKIDMNMPKLEQAARRALREGADLVKHPGFTAATGLPNPFKGGFGLFTVPGTPARGFLNRLEKVKSGAFLTAFENLKGAGAITETEGAKATAAMAAMDAATSESDFKAALQDYLDVIATGYNTAKTQVQRGRAQIGATDANPFSYESVLAEQRRRAAARTKGR
jgi:hypothetical protein